MIAGGTKGPVMLVCIVIALAAISAGVWFVQSASHRASQDANIKIAIEELRKGLHVGNERWRVRGKPDRFYSRFVPGAGDRYFGVQVYNGHSRRLIILGNKAGVGAAILVHDETIECLWYSEDAVRDCLELSSLATE